jgi:hypothetical protein
LLHPSDHRGIARAFKDIAGNITKLNEPYFVFRLFSMTRTEEMKRFIAIHPKVLIARCFLWKPGTPDHESPL